MVLFSPQAGIHTVWTPAILCHADKAREGKFNGLRGMWILTCRFYLWCLGQGDRTRFFSLDRIGTQAPVSYPSIVFDAAVGIYAMHLSETVNVEKETLCYRHEYAKGIRS